MKSEEKNKFINIYKDENGRFISDEEWSTYKDAFDNRDKLNTYIETVKIIHNLNTKP